MEQRLLELQAENDKLRRALDAALRWPYLPELLEHVNNPSLMDKSPLLDDSYRADIYTIHDALQTGKQAVK